MPRSLLIIATFMTKGAHSLQLYMINGRTRASQSLSSSGVSVMFSSVHLCCRAKGKGGQAGNNGKQQARDDPGWNHPQPQRKWRILNC